MKNKTLPIKSILIFYILNFSFCIFSNAQVQQNNVRIVDTVYTPAGYPGGALNGKLWLPSVTNGAAIVLMHGWGSAAPDDLHLWGDVLSSYGYVVLSIDYYGMWNDFGVPCVYPAPVSALKTGVEFLRKNSLAFGCYTDKVGSIGISGGAIHTAQTITWDNDDTFFSTNPNINDHLDASVLFYGWYDYFNHLESIFNDIPGAELTTLVTNYFSPNPLMSTTKGNPLANVSNITTPVLLFHGTTDAVFQVVQSEEFRDSLVAHGKSETLYEIAGGGHVYEFHNSAQGFPHFSFNQWSNDGIISRDITLAWLARTLQVNNIHCPYNPSYWKNHSADWNADAIPMKLGTTNSYSKSQLLAILNSSSGDVSLKLSQELIAAKLNLANNSYALPIASTIIAADNLIGNRAIPVVPAIASNSSQGNQMTVFKNTLNTYNNGSLTPNCNSSGHRLAMEGENNESIYSLAIFPNPVSNSTTISFSLFQSQNVSIKIFDINGRLVSTLANRYFEAGENKITWNTDELNGGIYFLQLQSDENLRMEKLLITK